MQDEGRSIILVTHSAQTVRDFCDSAVLLSHGELIAQGDVDAVLTKYEALP
jgi:ABC-type polysaccharide/polyol phosphate transport system ATPase subunit